jgi:hypothetical protein
MGKSLEGSTVFPEDAKRLLRSADNKWRANDKGWEALCFGEFRVVACITEADRMQAG